VRKKVRLCICGILLKKEKGKRKDLSRRKRNKIEVSSKQIIERKEILNMSSVIESTYNQSFQENNQDQELFES